MFGNKRIEWVELVQYSSMYLIANCKSFRNADGKKARAYERELILSIAQQGEEKILFLSKDKEKKTTVRDIARNAFQRFSDCTNAGDTKNARESIRQGVNSIIKILLGNELYKIIEETYSATLSIVENHLDELTKEEETMLAAVGMELRNRGINAGLVKA